MNASAEIKVSEVRNVSDIDFSSANGLSFFDPYLEYWEKETLEIAGEVHVSRTSAGDVSGIFLYDGHEKDGSIFTRSRDVFDYFYNLRPFKSIYAELPTERPKETYDIDTIDKDEIDEIRKFMLSTDPRLNPKWVKVALNSKDKCVTVRLGDEIAGVGWLSLVNGVGRLHSLFVKPRFRKMGVGLDILFARLLWLRSKHARTAFSEISVNNLQSTKTSMKGGMKVSGHVYQYFRTQPRNAATTAAIP